MNQWQKRRTEELLCPSGNTAVVRRPGPELALKAGKIMRILQKNKNAKQDIDAQLAFIEKLSDAELDTLMEFGRVLLADVVVTPVLILNPKEGQLSPDDVPLQDFWFIYIWAMNGGPSMPVKTREGETTVEAVETFPDGQASDVVSGDYGAEIQSPPC